MPRSQALLGVVQGLTEFLPVSSTAHLLIGERLLGYDDPGGVFTVMIQLGSILAVDVAVSRARSLARRRAACRRGPDARHFALMIVVGVRAGGWSPALLLADFVRACAVRERHRRHRRRRRCRRCIVGGIVMLPSSGRPTRRVERATPVPRALAIGVCQTLALIPGVSRSGATIVGGMAARARSRGGRRVLVLSRDADDGGGVRARAARSAATSSPADRRARDRRRLRDGLPRGAARRQAVPGDSCGASGFAPFAWYRIAAGAVAAGGVAAGWRVATMHWLRRSFIAGFFVTVPLFISVAAFIWMFGVVDGLTAPFYDRLLGRGAIPGLGIVTTAVVIVLVGRVRDQRDRQAAAAAGGGLAAARAGVPDDLRAGQAAGRRVFAGQRVRVQAGGAARGQARATRSGS